MTYDVAWRGSIRQRFWILAMVFVVAGLATGAGSVAAECAWDDGFWLSEFENDVEALVVYDDGSGGALYAGGYFTLASGVTVNGVAKWDGTQWSALAGPYGTNMDAGTKALAVYDDGNGEALYAGGDFTTAGGITVNHIAKWDGTQWSALSGPAGTGMDSPNSTVEALAVYDDGSGEALYAGGSFSTASGISVNGIAKWDGAQWSAMPGPLGTGVLGSVFTLAVYDDGSGEALYVGGYFTTAGGRTVNNIAKWDGTLWLAQGGPNAIGVGSGVNALAVYDDGYGEALYACGPFTSAGGVAVKGIAKWDGMQWSAMPGIFGSFWGSNGWAHALAVYDDGSGEALYAGGWLTDAGEVWVHGIAKWDGSG